MATGFLTPDGRLRVFSDLGVVLPGAKLHTYVAGTPSTDLASYSDVGLTVPNANPVAASAGGLFGPIYLTPGVAYKLVLTDASDVAVWSQDNVATPGTLAAGAGISLATVAGVTTITATGPAVASIGVNDFVLTLESGVPYSTTDQTAKTTLYATPSGRGNRIDLYDAGGAPTAISSAQVSIAVPATTATLYSVFAYTNAGVLTLELAAWTNDTTPGTAAYSVSAVTGTWTKTGDLTRRLVGLMRTTGVSGQTEDSFAKRYIASLSNRLPRILRPTQEAGTWTYTLAAYQQMNANAANQLDLLVVVPGQVLEATVASMVQNGTAVTAFVSIGEDSATVAMATVLGGVVQTPTLTGPISASLRHVPAIGRHFYAALEKSGAAGTTHWGPTANSMDAGGHAGILGTIS